MRALSSWLVLIVACSLIHGFDRHDLIVTDWLYSYRSLLRIEVASG